MSGELFRRRRWSIRQTAEGFHAYRDSDYLAADTLAEIKAQVDATPRFRWLRNLS